MNERQRIKRAALALAVALAVALSALAFGGQATVEDAGGTDIAYGPCWRCGYS